MRSLCIFCACVFVIGTAPPCLAQSSDELRLAEDSVKAAYLYKFASYVDWPERDRDELESPLQIGVFGARELADELTAITTGRQVEGRPILVRELRSSDPIDDLHILFVGRDEARRLDKLLEPAKSLPILTVTDSGDALAAGSIINFIVSDERVRFEISLSEAERSGLRLDSRLLAVAESVQRAGN